jgi:uncharacterized membrane protein
MMKGTVPFSIKAFLTLTLIGLSVLMFAGYTELTIGLALGLLAVIEVLEDNLSRSPSRQAALRMANRIISHKR